MASIKFSVDCSLRRDLSVKGCSMVVNYLDSWYVGDPQNDTIGRIGIPYHTIGRIGIPYRQSGKF